MRSIDLFTFRDMFATVRSIAIVGNAPCILDWQNGKIIDSYDMVVRFNRATTAGIEGHIGSRTDVLFVNASNSLEMSPSPTSTIKPQCLVCFISPQGAKSLGIEPFSLWTNDCPVLSIFGPDLIGLPTPNRTRPLTSGTYALYTLLRLFEVEKLYISGFTMFGAVPGGAGKYYKDDRTGIGVFHDLDQEAKIFSALLGSFKGELFATGEIFALAKQNAINLSSPSLASVNHARKLKHRLFRRFAEGLSWRCMRLGTSLRRFAESKL